MRILEVVLTLVGTFVIALLSFFWQRWRQLQLNKETADASAAPSLASVELIEEPSEQANEGSAEHPAEEPAELPVEEREKEPVGEPSQEPAVDLGEKGDGDGNNELAENEFVELAKIELAAHTAMYTQALEGLKTVPSRVAPLFGFGAALIGFIATIIVKEYGPIIASRQSVTRYFEIGLVAVAVSTVIVLLLSGIAVAQVAALIYLPRGTSERKYIKDGDEIGSYLIEGKRYVEAIQSVINVDTPTATVLYSAAVMKRNAIGLLKSVRRARMLIGTSVCMLILSVTITLFGFSYCITQFGMSALSSSEGSPTSDQSNTGGSLQPKQPAILSEGWEWGLGQPGNGIPFAPRPRGPIR